MGTHWQPICCRDFSAREDGKDLSQLLVLYSLESSNCHWMYLCTTLTMGYEAVHSSHPRLDLLECCYDAGTLNAPDHAVLTFQDGFLSLSLVALYVSPAHSKPIIVNVEDYGLRWKRSQISSSAQVYHTPCKPTAIPLHRRS